MKQAWSPLQIALLVFILAATAAVVGGFLYFWRYGFNADFTMVGLMAMRFLETGEVPIFVWKVGYQGMLLEAGSVALAFKFFGIGPHSLNLAPAFFFLALIALYGFSLKQWSGRSVALLSVLIYVLIGLALKPLFSVRNPTM